MRGVTFPICTYSVHFQYVQQLVAALSPRTHTRGHYWRSLKWPPSLHQQSSNDILRQARLNLYETELSRPLRQLFIGTHQNGKPMEGPVEKAGCSRPKVGQSTGCLSTRGVMIPFFYGSASGIISTRGGIGIVKVVVEIIIDQATATCIGHGIAAVQRWPLMSALSAPLHTPAFGLVGGFQKQLDASLGLTSGMEDIFDVQKISSLEYSNNNTG